MAPADESGRSYTFEIFAASFAALLLEISYTRIVSFKLFYYYTYLVIGLALLGIGSGAVIVAVSARLQRVSTERIIGWSLVLAAAATGLGYVLVARIGIDTLAIWDYGSGASFENVARLVAICLAVFASFFAVGVLIATLFARHPHRINRLYFADLLGAGLGCALVVPIISWLDPPATIFVAGAVLAAAGAWTLGRGRTVMSIVSIVLALLLVGGAAASGSLPDPRTDASKVPIDRSHEIYSAWSPIFRVDVVTPPGNARLLDHDALIGSAIYRFNGKLSSLGRYDQDARRFPFSYRSAGPRQELIIGAAGGNEVLASLHFGARHIDAVELNPATYDLVTGHFADYVGHFTDLPQVNYVNDEGRSYLAHSDHHYGLIWYTAPDSYAASNAASAGAFVLSESYLYTSEAIQKSLEKLTPDGIVATQFGEFNYEKKPNRSTRYVATARRALDEIGVSDPSRHILVVTSPAGVGHTLTTILVKRTAFTNAEVERFVGTRSRVPHSQLRYAPGHRPQGKNDTVNSLMHTPNAKLDAFYDAYPYDVRPITDNAPFFWHFVTFDKVVKRFADPIDRIDFEDALGERVLVLLLVVAIVFAAVFLLLPFLRIRRVWTSLPRKGRSAVYFAALGFGFIFFEITLIQRLVLFLGYPTYSLTVTLMSLLVFTGIGAFFSSRWRIAPSRVLMLLLGVIAVLTLFYEVGLTPLTNALLGTPLAVRIVVSFIVLAPLGLCLGNFMPLGLGTVADLSDAGREYVAWGWAVNGFASVIGSVLSTILAMTFGFRVVMGIALVVYAIAVFTLRAVMRDAEQTPSPDGGRSAREAERKDAKAPQPAVAVPDVG